MSIKVCKSAKKTNTRIFLILEEFQLKTLTTVLHSVFNPNGKVFSFKKNSQGKFCLNPNGKVFSFEKNSVGKNPPGPLSFITLDSETEEELPPRFVSQLNEKMLTFLKSKVCALLVSFPRKLGQCWSVPHLRIFGRPLVHRQELVLGRKRHNRSLGILSHCQVCNCA